MNLNYYEWIDSLGFMWQTIQSPEWVAGFDERKDGSEKCFVLCSIRLDC